jgi:hypothetical protein
MTEREPHGMKQDPVAGTPPPAVPAISHNHQARRVQVRTNLMLPSGAWMRLDERTVAPPSEHRKRGLGRLTAGCDDSHAGVPTPARRRQGAA